MTVAYPLQWPAGWPRASEAQLVVNGKHSFRRNNRASPFWTFADARDSLLEELRLMGAAPGRTVISTNYPADKYGLPVERGRKPEDVGVAVYFEWDGRQLVMACDRYDRAEENMRSMALAIEAMRQLDRHGGGQMMSRAFEGFAALPAAGPDCWTVLGLKAGASADQIQSAYRARARAAHPDTGGTTAAMAELNAARDEALRQAVAS